jgi:hypothetical protein
VALDLLLAHDLAQPFGGMGGGELRAQTSYTYSRFEFVRDDAFGNHDLPGAPRHFTTASLRWRHGTGLWLAPQLEWVARRWFVDSENQHSAGEYAIWNVRAGFDHERSGVSVFVEGRNLADRDYVSSVVVDAGDQRYFEPGDGRGRVRRDRMALAVIRGRLGLALLACALAGCGRGGVPVPEAKVESRRELVQPGAPAHRPRDRSRARARARRRAGARMDPPRRVGRVGPGRGVARRRRDSGARRSRRASGRGRTSAARTHRELGRQRARELVVSAPRSGRIAVRVGPRARDVGG